MSKLSKIKVGITGMIGSGKSTVTKLISKDYQSVSSDKIVADLYKDQDFVKMINKEILNIDSIVLDKSKIAKKIFSDKKSKDKIEGIIFPIVKEELKTWLNSHNGLVFVEAPLLFEAKFEDLFDYIIVVLADKEIIIERLIKNRNYSKKEANSRITNQMPQNEKVKKADYIIYNNEGLKELENNVSKVLKILKEKD